MNYIYRYFDEISWAEEIIKRGEFPDLGTGKEVKLICKYYRKQIAEEIGMSLEDINKDYRKMKEISRETEKRVIQFCKKAVEGFNYVRSFQLIQRAVRLSEKFYAFENDPIPITVKEWETIQSLEDEDAKKILFMKLVDAKYTISHRKTIGRHDYNDEEYFNREGITQEMYCREMKVTRKNFRKTLKILRQEGMIEFKDIYGGKFGRKCLDKVMIVEDDLDAPIQDWITDYHNLLLHYERLMGANIGTCKKCGKLFRQSETRNKFKYCEEHRVSNQKEKENQFDFDFDYKRMAKNKSADEPERRLCFKCLSRFEVSKRGNTSQQVFCKKCQAEINKQKKAEYMRRKRAEEKQKSGNEIEK